MNIYTDLKNKIKNKKAVITLVGLGYVGLPIALEFCKKGFKVNGFDLASNRIEKLKKGHSYINDIPSKDIKAALKKGFYPTCDAKVINEADCIIICVPTPLRKIKDPDVSYIVNASRTLRKHMRAGQLVVLESTTYPGTTREIMLPEMEKSRLKLGKDFCLAFSPERIDPGNPKYQFANIPKVVGGFSKQETELVKLLYSSVVNRVIGVSTPESAEVTKLLENTFRIVNIGLINEFANLCDRLGIDVWEVIEAAKSKPFGFMPFYPGPGIGGHCIPADPMYLSWKARRVGFKTKMIDIAASVNRDMPKYTALRAEKILASKGKRIQNANVLIIGVTYKKDVNDLRESPALDLIEALKGKKCKLKYYDPYIPYLDIHGIKGESVELTGAIIKKQDLVIVVTDHSDINYKNIAKNAKLIFDTRNIFENKGIRNKNIIKL
ncbi:MAG: nucleotide sugar dehydrogenase [Candidatus Omnitrophica bacterium]|nr:nucleotide sugar dehydrogenase [Candidatus Omnitrophota bacterium]